MDNSGESVFVPRPQTLCESCLEDADNVIQHPSDGSLWCWCPHVKYGGAYSTISGQWTVLGPFDDGEHWIRYSAQFLTEPMEATRH